MNKSKFVCNKCDKTFISVNEINKHKRLIHSNDRQFVCPRSDCWKTFKRRDHLIRHKQTHCSVKPFKCNQCYQRFSRRSHVNRHKRTVHQKNKPFKCDVQRCDQSSDKPFKCNQCDYRFTERRLLNRHENTVHLNIKPFKCDVEGCHKSNDQRSHLMQHKNDIHSNDMRFKCLAKNCSEICFTAEDIKQHILWEHTNQSPEVVDICSESEDVLTEPETPDISGEKNVSENIANDEDLIIELPNKLQQINIIKKVRNACLNIIEPMFKTFIENIN